VHYIYNLLDDISKYMYAYVRMYVCACVYVHARAHGLIIDLILLSINFISDCEIAQYITRSIINNN